MSNLCVIPARGGSKRIPKKNIKEFLGKPIIAYSIETALQSGLFDEVMVSTDDAEIAEVAKNYGAQVPFLRSKENANDVAVLADVIEEVVSRYQSLGQVFRYVCCILPTAPLVTPENLKQGLDLLVRRNFDSVKPVVRFSYPIQRALRFVDGKTYMFIPDNQNVRSQDLEAAYHDAGQFYWMKRECGLKGKEKGGFELSELEVQDIDSDVDWKMAEIKFQMINKMNNT